MKEYQDVVKQQALVHQTRRKDNGREKRTEEELWTWDRRAPEKTTRKQRFHLNTRNQRKRSKLELRRMRARKKYDAFRAEARKQAARLEGK
jgi:hypothetical protein